MTSSAKWVFLLAAALVALPLGSVEAHCGACGAGDHDHAAKTEKKTNGDIVETAVEAGSFETLVAAVKAAGLVETLTGEGPFTVFAPNDAAFAKLPEGTIPALLEDRAALRSVLTYHVVPGKITAKDLSDRRFLETANGQSLSVDRSGDEVRIDGAKVLSADVPAKNGVIHVIDSVVLPRKNLVETAKAAGSFETLLAAAKAAGLVEVLAGQGPYTVFAPTDEAFAKLPEGTLESLLEDPAALKAILTYHVVPGRVLSSEVSKSVARLKTVHGAEIELVRRSDGRVSVNGSAQVLTADVLAGNGVIHVIDTVILPR